MASVTVSIEGPSLAQYLGAFRTQVSELLSQFAELTADYARQFCPVDTGHLRSTIKVRGYDGNTIFEVSVDAPYAFWVHFGTMRMPPRPFMQEGEEAALPWYRNELRYFAERVLALTSSRGVAHGL